MSKPLHVLIVQDSKDDTELVIRELDRGGYDVSHQRVQTANSMTAALDQSSWDLVISDYSLAAFSAMEALATLRTKSKDLPFIIISGVVGEEAAVAAMKAGADDFLIKGRLSRLVPTVERELRAFAQGRERERALEALRRSEAHYRSLVEHAVFGLYQATADGRFLAVNPALVTMLGYASADELLAVGLANLYADESVRADGVRRQQGQFAGEEVMWRRKSGEPIRVRLSGRTIETPDRNQSALEVIVEDITERHRLQEQLRQAQKMEAVGQLAGGVAHDFNNMLTAILGYSELLTEQIGPDKPIGRDLRAIVTAAERAAALTRQLLAFSRKQVLAVIPLNLTRVVRDVEPMLRRLIGEHITIKTELSTDLDAVMADATQLDQVLMNLAVNARDAMPRGGSLTIATRNATFDDRYAVTHPGAKAGDYAMLSVSDTGMGMSSEIQARIFEPFFTTKGRGRGTGLGLAAVYGIVKQLSGYVAVESEPGEGTTFRIYLPRTDQPAYVPPEPVAAAAPVGAETVLLVEDEDGVRSFIKVALQRFGYRVVEAASAQAALSLLAGLDTPVQLLLTDVVLPGMDGRELAAQVTRDQPGVQVLFMSGYTDRMRSTDGYLEPGVHLLEKPFTAEALLTKTRQILGHTMSEYKSQPG
jgi:two-component system cell cycle sensor histidine kinase/response regulator CckA